MKAVEYFPPIQMEATIGESKGSEGHVSSVTVLLKDAHGALFSLHVATEANYVASALEFEDQIEFPEPVFMVPSMSIDDELVTDIIGGTTPEVLGLYLVPQE